MSFRILAIGDIVGTPGRTAVRELLPDLVSAHQIDFVVANAENMVSGSGITTKTHDKLINYGVDAITSGDHIWKRMEVTDRLIPGGRLLRPENYPPDCPGRGVSIIESKSGAKVAIINVLGRLFMQPIDCPYQAVDRALEEIGVKTRIILVDFHAEATSEKISMGWYLEGRISALWGTHTHVQTSDNKILPEGTAYITDLGMTGAHHSVLGRKIEPVLRKMIKQLPAPFDVAEEDLRLSGVVITVDAETGRATEIERIHVPYAP